MNQEKLINNVSEYVEMDILKDLYAEIYQQGGMVRETKQSSGYLTCVGDIEDFRAALNLEPGEEITHEALDGLPVILLFASPGSGETRVEALENAFTGWKQVKESVETGRSLYSSFEIAGGEMKAYYPSYDAPKLEWTIEYIREGKVVFTSSAAMAHDPIFGADVEDMATLNEKVEELIAEHNLES